MENVASTITHLFAVTDQRDWAQVESAFDNSVWLDYRSTTGRAPGYFSPREVVDLWAGLLPGFDRTHHELFDLEVNEEEDIALAHCRGKAEHFIDEEVFVVEGTYDTMLVKRDGRWLICEFKFSLIDWSGNRKLAEVAIERAKAAQ